MRRRQAIALLALFSGCGSSSSNSDGGTGQEVRTHGVTVQVPNCTFSVTTPDTSYTPIPDNGTQPIGTPSALHLSWTGDPQTSISIVWSTDVDSRGTRVEFGTTDFSQKASGFSFSYPSDLASSAPPTRRIHEVHLCGLMPGTTYQYRVAGTSAQGTFATAPSGTGKPFRFAVGGDSRSNAPQWGALLAAMQQDGAAFVLYTGDAVDLGFVQDSWDQWFDVGKMIFPSMPLQFALGNHEIDAPHYFAQFAMPGNEQWYSFDYGDVHFVVLNDTPTSTSTIPGDQKDFLTKDLQATTKKWKVVMHHRAIFSSSLHGSQTDLQMAWMPVYDQFGVDVVFNGHDHDYERTKPMKGGQVASDGNGTVYLVNGGGGADPYKNGTSDFTAYSKTTYGFTLVDVSGNTMTLSNYGMDGVMSMAVQNDQYTITKN